LKGKKNKRAGERRDSREGRNEKDIVKHITGEEKKWRNSIHDEGGAVREELSEIEAATSKGKKKVE